MEVSFVLATSLFGVWNTELRLEHCQMEQLDFPHEIGQKSDTILILQYIWIVTEQLPSKAILVKRCLMRKILPKEEEFHPA